MATKKKAAGRPKKKSSCKFGKVASGPRKGRCRKRGKTAK